MAKPYLPNPPVTPDDPTYITAAKGEVEFWENAPIQLAEHWWAAPLGPMKRHYNRRLTGDERVHWYDTIRRNTPGRALVLGSGSMLIERQLLTACPHMRFTMSDIDQSSLDRRDAEYAASFPDRVVTHQADLNFAELEPDTYDLIVSVSTLHHIVNLEHVAAQINRALTPHGTFVLYDFTGASGFRFPETQRRIFEEIYARERSRRPETNLPDVAWRNVDDGTYSPFEAVRSAETIDILSTHLDETSGRGAGAIVWLLLFAGIAEQFTPMHALRARRSHVGRLGRRDSNTADSLIWERMLSPQFFEELTLMDEIVTDAAFFPPNNTFATYRKKPHTP